MASPTYVVVALRGRGNLGLRLVIAAGWAPRRSPVWRDRSTTRGRLDLVLGSFDEQLTCELDRRPSAASSTSPHSSASKPMACNAAVACTHTAPHHHARPEHLGTHVREARLPSITTS
jgi:hypothetical protein